MCVKFLFKIPHIRINEWNLPNVLIKIAPIKQLIQVPFEKNIIVSTKRDKTESITLTCTDGSDTLLTYMCMCKQFITISVE